MEGKIIPLEWKKNPVYISGLITFILVLIAVSLFYFNINQNLQIAGIPFEFDYIYGQPPNLGVENQEADVEELKSKGTIEYSLGDKLSDLERGKIDGCKSIFVRWGHPSGGEEEFADYSINNPKELEDIIK